MKPASRSVSHRDMQHGHIAAGASFGVDQAMNEQVTGISILNFPGFFLLFDIGNASSLVKPLGEGTHPGKINIIFPSAGILIKLLLNHRQPLQELLGPVIYDLLVVVVIEIFQPLDFAGNSNVQFKYVDFFQLLIRQCQQFHDGTVSGFWIGILSELSRNISKRRYKRGIFLLRGSKWGCQKE